MSLNTFFNPRSVAIVGASRQKGKIGYEILMNMVKAGYEGYLYPVNAQADEIEGIRCYHDIPSIGVVPDLVVIAVPAKFVPEVMEQCGKVGVKAVIIVAAGFKEIGEEGKKIEEEVFHIAKRTDMRIIGPNCLGLINPGHHVNACFGSDLPAVGEIGYISQSGALLAAILDMANDKGIGFSKLVSIGNKVDVNELDLVRTFGDDPETTVIAGYLESIDNGNQFVKEAEEISLTKPIVLIKSGTTAAGAKAVSSHTGSLAGGEMAYESAFKRAGLIRATSIKQQFDYAVALAYQPLPQGSRVAVITNAGGPGIMATDSIEAKGLTFATLSDETKKRLREGLPKAANIHNPVDVLGDAGPERYELALDAVLDDPGVDAVLVVLTPQAVTDCNAVAETVVRKTHEKLSKPVLAAFLGALKVRQASAILAKGRVPQYDSIEAAVQTIKVMTEYVRWKERPKRVVKLFAVNRRKVESIIERHRRQGLKEIGEAEAKEILEAYGFVTPKDAIATTAEQAANIAEQIGFPVVLKIWSPDIIHKSDVDGVRVGLESRQEVKDIFDLMMFRIPQKRPDAKIMGVLVQEMCTGRQEVILGMNRDPQFGPLMMFGLGGTMVEVLKDVSFYLAPLTAEEARQMLIATKTYRMLKGVRGKEGVDIDRIAEGLQRVSQLVTEFPMIKEMDINPYLVGPEGTAPVAVDARITLQV